MLAKDHNKLEVIRRALKLVRSPDNRRKCGIAWNDDLPVIEEAIKAQNHEVPKARAAMMLAFSKINPIATAGEFYEFIRYCYPDIGDTTHSAMAYEVFGGELPWSTERVCPQCSARAFGVEEALELFGYRHKGRAFQSQCRECRAMSAKQTYKDKKNADRLGKDWEDGRKKMPDPTGPIPVDPRLVRLAKKDFMLEPADPTKPGPGLPDGPREKKKKNLAFKQYKKLQNRLKLTEEIRRRRVKGGRKVFKEDGS